ncbi:hypothetical protein P879_06231 [Paragonimus westermani]|uniref:Folate receptor-like domain-containing protein n=1 Tax=Paragonimus westermani TaxID=34504 RepID=A0A8T0DAB0_9TREM|nr:hypothetical protein P879_06231 [Paragonimus westermani]
MNFHPTFVMTLTLLIQTKLCSTDNRLNHIRTVDEYINTCPVRVEDNKTIPRAGPGDKICSDWSQLSCCSPETEEQIREQVLHRFDLSHWFLYACVRDWSVEFEWHSGKNTCPSEKECKSFSSIYKHSKDFCESIWDGSWRVERSDRCFHFTSNAAPFHKHNREVSVLRAKEILKRLTAGTTRPKMQALRTWLVCAAFMIVSQGRH